MNPRNPMPWEVRGLKSEYIVFYNNKNQPGHWDMVRMTDDAVMASGSLNAMLDLLPMFPNSRRATLGEDFLRNPARIFFLDYTYGKKTTSST